MTNLSTTKKSCFKADSFEVLAVKNPEIKPFINIFQIEGQNIQQQKLGKIFGVIQVDDNSENSEYLPNLLTQILKKEYFKNKNKKCGESFEIALHKLNLALTELTQHEIVKWINNLNAVIGVICNNEIHFTQIGQGCLVFLKDGKVNKINSENDPSEEYHPMKTFSSVSTGKLKIGDKLIFTIQKTFQTILEDELRRHYKTFNSDEFDNIISSTLRNEALETGMVVVNIKDQEETVLESSSSETEEAPREDLNFFGEIKNKKISSKINKNIPAINETEKIKEEESSLDRPFENESSKKSPFEHEPEIFIKEKEEDLPGKLTTKESEKLALIKDNLSAFFEKTKEFLKNQSEKHSIKKISFNKVNIKKFSDETSQKINKKTLPVLKDWASNKFKKINIEKVFKKFPVYSKKGWGLVSEKFQKISKNLDFLNKKNNPSNFIEKIEDKIDFELPENKIDLKIKNQFAFKRSLKKIRKLKKKIINSFNSILKDKSKRKISLIILVSLIIFIGISIVIIRVRNSETNSFEKLGENLSQTISKKDSTDSVRNLRPLIDFDKTIKDSTFLKNDLFLLTDENSLIKFSVRDNNKTEILLPENFENPQYLSAIESLQLVFIVSSEEVYSYSPITNSFSRNTINIPENSEIIGAGTYLTYLYLLDKNFNQVYRYHRAPGGFGSYKNWLLEVYDLNSATNLAISDSVYITFDNGKIDKYFQGKKEFEINLEEDFIPNKIRAKIDKNEILVLDQEQGKIIKLSDKGQQQEIYQDKQFKKASDFSVDFENKQIFIITEEKKLLVFNY